MPLAVKIIDVSETSVLLLLADNRALLLATLTSVQYVA